MLLNLFEPKEPNPREFSRVCALEAELHLKPSALHFKPKGLQVREFTRVCALEADWAGWAGLAGLGWLG